MIFHTSAEKKSKELKTRLLKSEKNVKYVLLNPDRVSESHDERLVWGESFCSHSGCVDEIFLISFLKLRGLIQCLLGVSAVYFKFRYNFMRAYPIWTGILI